MHLLAIDTATEACSVALWSNGQVRERFDVAPRRHAELALPWAQALLDEAGLRKSQLDAIAVGRGPGAFTGVRLAVSLAQGMALALDLPVVPVSTLATLAMQAPQGQVAAAIDARMGEVYLGLFERSADDCLPLADEAVLPPEQVTLPDGAWHAVGTGLAAADGLLTQRHHARWLSVDAAALPHAADVARLAVQAFARGQAVAADRLEPAYLRQQVALTIEQRRQQGLLR